MFENVILNISNIIRLMFVSQHLISFISTLIKVENNIQKIMIFRCVALKKGILIWFPVTYDLINDDFKLQSPEHVRTISSA